MTAIRGSPASHDHAVHHPVRRRRLRHAAVRAGLRACGNARTDEFRQPCAWRVCHDGRLCLRGPGQSIRLAVLCSLAAGVCRQRDDRRGAGALALSASLQPQPSRSGAVQRRPRLHVGGGGRLHHGIIAGFHQTSGRARWSIRPLRGRYRPLPADDHRDLRPADRGAATGTGTHAVRQPVAGGGGRSARGNWARHQRAAGVCIYLHLRLWACRLGRRLERRDFGARSVFSAEVHDLLPDRGDRRRLLQHHRAVPGVAAARHRRRRRQILRAEARAVRDLHHHDRDPDLAPERSVRPRRRPLSVLMTAQADVGHRARQHARWHWSEIAFWILALSCAFLFPSRYLIMTDIVRLALFELSLDLILGSAGIVSLGHAAFFGVGAYSAGLLALHGIVTEPVMALVVAGLAATVVGFLTSFLVIRGVDLTRLMVTLGIALLLEALAERFSTITGGTDGVPGTDMAPLLGLFV